MSYHGIGQLVPNPGYTDTMMVVSVGGLTNWPAQLLSASLDLRHSPGVSTTSAIGWVCWPFWIASVLIQILISLYFCPCVCMCVWVWLCACTCGGACLWVCSLLALFVCECVCVCVWSYVCVYVPCMFHHALYDCNFVFVCLCFINFMYYIWYIPLINLICNFMVYMWVFFFN